MPRKLVLTNPKEVKLLNYEEREVKSNEVKVKVIWAAPKHGTEISDYRGETPFLDNKFDSEWKMFVEREPSEERGVKFGEFVLGNQWVGEIIEKGSDVSEYNLGDTVCTYGGLRETDVVNAVNNPRLRKIPTGGSWKNAVCYDPAQYALGGVRDGNVKPGDRVAVFGLGAIGQIAVQMCRNIGAEVIAIDPIEIRRDIAVKHGAILALDPMQVDVGYELKKFTDKVGVDCVIETSGHPSALQSGLRGLGYDGVVSYVAFGKEIKGGLNFGKEAHFNYGKIIFSRAGSEPTPGAPRWSRARMEEVCWRMLMDGSLDCEDIVSPVVDFESLEETYGKYIDREPNLSIKMGVKF